MLVTNQHALGNDTVLQPGKKVVKPNNETDCDRRFKSLELQISELKSLLLLNEDYSIHKNKKEADPNGLGRIRTGDLCHVKAMSERFCDKVLARWATE